MNKIVLFTSNTKGGIIQLTEQLCRELSEMKYSVRCFVPDTVEESTFLAENQMINKYKKINTINPKDSGVKRLANEIYLETPDLVWFTDSTILTYEVCLALEKKSIKCMVTFHDAAGFHPANRLSLRKKMHNMVLNTYSKTVIEKADILLTLSEESKIKMQKKYPAQGNKVRMMNLGAHIPAIEPICPPEMKESSEDYFMFFGRIDKYKGLDTLFSAYLNVGENKPMLVVAGSGRFSDRERELADKSQGLIINRYISDSEMIWLFQNALAIVLPYIEATQSGVIPIAYHYGKPVIVSDVPGLTQFVVDGKTGFICRTEKDYISKINIIQNVDLRKQMNDECIQYSHCILEWKKNIRVLLKGL